MKTSSGIFKENIRNKKKNFCQFELLLLATFYQSEKQNFIQKFGDDKLLIQD